MTKRTSPASHCARTRSHAAWQPGSQACLACLGMSTQRTQALFPTTSSTSCYCSPPPHTAAVQPRFTSSPGLLPRIRDLGFISLDRRTRQWYECYVLCFSSTSYLNATSRFGLCLFCGNRSSITM